jgi:hypothetical protein
VWLEFLCNFKWNISHSKKNLARCIKKIYWYSCKISVTLLDFNETWIFRQIFKKKIHEYPFSGSHHVPCGRTDGRTDGRGEASIRFSKILQTRLTTYSPDDLVLVICAPLEMSHFTANGSLWEPSTKSAASYHRGNYVFMTMSDFVISFNQTWIFYAYKIWPKSVQWETDRRLDGQTGRTKVIVAFRNFVNAPKILKTRTPLKT